MYENFREALDPEVPAEELVPRYKELVHALPDINQYLLLYVLDLLHVFAKNSDKNLMTAASESTRRLLHRTADCRTCFRFELQG